MSKQTEALRLALEALETLMLERGSIYENAIIAIREALAEQPAQQQEPVAIVEVVVPHLESIVVKHILDAPFPKVGDFFYTSPPASKPLTNEQMFELAEIAWRHGWASCRDAEYVGEEAEDERWGMVGAEVVQDIEAKLKDKNGY